MIEFPHYTWGYIVVQPVVAVLRSVPSLYVRVYHNPRYGSVTVVRSLTIREGISPRLLYHSAKSPFPHYTWGYIEAVLCFTHFGFVPSLYVRVYRGCQNQSGRSGCSLTIREGISETTTITRRDLLFPHYTWGYIVVFVKGLFCSRVPSLYVRVYRCYAVCFSLPAGSLTIREGISDFTSFKVFINGFPHYTWGYIGFTYASDIKGEVPSLYVRVYR